MASEESLKARKPTDYPFHSKYQTRWSDNDMYGHINNTVYYHLFDSVVNTYLATRCSQKPMSSLSIGLVVHSHCDYFAPASYPELLNVGLRVKKLGKSSVTYDIGIFGEGEAQEIKAAGEFVHVFVERDSRKPLQTGMEQTIKKGLETLLVSEDKASKL